MDIPTLRSTPARNMNLTLYLCDAAASGLLEPITDAFRAGHMNLQLHKDPVEKRSILHIAVQYGHMHIVRYLLEQKANVDEMDVNRRTPLHFAVIFDRHELIPVLADAGAAMDCRDKELQTPLHLACTKGNLDLTNLIVECGADYSLRNNVGKLAIDLLPAEIRGKARNMWHKTRLSRAVQRLKEYKYGTNRALRVQDQKFLLNQNDETLYGFLVPASSNYAELDHIGLDVLPMSLITKLAERNVKHLNVSNNRLLALPTEVSSITSLKTLDIRANHIDSLPPTLALMPVLEKVRFEGNPLRSIPASLRQSSWGKVSSYLKAVSDRASRWSEYKLLLVGEEGVGKSTLLKCIRSRKNKSSCRKNLATDGIDVHRITLAGSADKAGGMDQPLKLTLKCWDLGGQEVFYPTHLLFLRSNCVYVVVYNMSNPNMQRVDYWMNSIRAVTGNSSTALIFIVGTHADGRSLTTAGVEEMLDRLRRKYSHFRFKGFVDAMAVSCKTGMGIKELQQKIQAAVVNSNMMPVVADSWVRLHDFLSNRQEQTVEWAQYEEWAASCGVSREELALATEFLCDAGSLIYFDDKVKDLHSLVVLDPQWLADLMSSIVTFRHRWVRQGVIQKEDVPSIFESYARFSHDTLLALLEKFHIIFRKRDGQSFIVPSMLPEHRPKELSLLWPTSPLDGQREYGRTYRFPFVPIGLFARFLVRVMHINDVTVHMLWRNGVLCKLEGSVGQQFALVEYTAGDVSFSIRIRESKPKSGSGSSRGELLCMLVNAADTLVECFSQMRDQVQRLIPCTHCLKSVALSDRPYYFPYEECIGAVTSGNPLLYCHHIVSSSRAVLIQHAAPDVSFHYVPLIRPGSLTVGECVGEGNSGVVRKGMLSLIDGQRVPVALKEISALGGGSGPAHKRLEDAFVDLQFEVAVMCKLSHPNLVYLYGISMQPVLSMVMEFVNGGDLWSYIHPSVGDNASAGALPSIAPELFPWPLRVYIALDVAEAMHHLQSINPPVIHRDLRSPNIFLQHIEAPDRPCLDRTMYAQVADFGLARHVATQISGSLRTWQWMAPETLASSSQYDERSDIYSYGMCLWEIATLACPFEEYASHPRFGREVMGVQTLSGMALKPAIVDEDVRPTLPRVEDGCPREIIDLIARCFEGNPEDRPSFAHIVDQLKKLVKVPAPAPDTAIRLAKKVPFEKADSPEDAAVVPSSSTSSSAGGSSGSGDRTSMLLDGDLARSRGDSLGELQVVHTVRLFQKQRATSLAQVGQWIVAGCNDGNMILFDSQTYEQVLEWQAHSDRIHVLLSPGDGSLWSSAEDGFVRAWTISSTGELSSPLCVQEWRPFVLDGRAKAVRVMCAVPGIAQPTVWMWASMAMTVQVWGAGSFKDIGTVSLEDGDIPISSIVAIREQVWISAKSTIYVFDANTRSLLAAWQQLEPVFTMATIADCVWAGASTGNISRWNMENGEVELLGEMEVHTGSVKVVSRVSSTLVLTGTSDGSMILWSLDGTALKEFHEHTDVVKSILRTVKDAVWTCSYDSSILIWERVRADAAPPV